MSKPHLHIIVAGILSVAVVIWAFTVAHVLVSADFTEAVSVAIAVLCGLLGGLATYLFCWDLMPIILRPKAPSVPTHTDTKQRYCPWPACRAPISVYHKYCGRCGTKLPVALGQSLPAQEMMMNRQIDAMQAMGAMGIQHTDRTFLAQANAMRGQTGFGWGASGLVGMNQDLFNYMGLGRSGLL